MDPYPPQIRKRIIELYDQGRPTKYIAELFGVCRSGVRRVRQHFRQRGTLDPLPRNPGRAPGLGEADQQRLRALVAATPDATLAELRSALGAAVAVSTVDRALTRLGLPLKKSPGGRPSRTGRT
jgi:transposase